MISVLINAYACAPNQGSEPGMAWNWIINLAKYCKLYVITEGEWKQELEIELKKYPHGKNITFFYNPVSQKIRNMCWNQGDWRFYYYYRKWQYKTLEIAKEIVKNEKIDILHQLNMIGFREPGCLWKIQHLPFIWGPVDAKEKFPINYLLGANLKTKLSTYLKNTITTVQLRGAWNVKKAVKRASFVVSASSESKKTFKKFFNLESTLINETGCRIDLNMKVKDVEFIDTDFNILWVGKFDFRKQLGIALKTVAQLKNKEHIKLHIVGGELEQNDFYRSIALQLGIDSNCIWHGKVSHKNVQLLMQRSNIFFFTSVAEGTPHVVLEAIGNRLPVVCFNTCGQGDVINDNVGCKIELSNPEQSILEFSELIDNLFNQKELLQNMVNNCMERQKELSWDSKVKEILNLYKISLGS